MTTPRLSTSLNYQQDLNQGTSLVNAEVGIAVEKIAKSESLSALFSYFKSWAPNDPSLKFQSGSVIKSQPKAEEVAA